MLHDSDFLSKKPLVEATLKVYMSKGYCALRTEGNSVVATHVLQQIT